MKIKIDPIKINYAIDISKQAYDRHLDVLKKWQSYTSQKVLQTLSELSTYPYSCITELNMISQHVSTFHKEVCKMSEANKNQQDNEIEAQIFQKIIQLKAKFKKLQKTGCFQGQKQIRSKIQNLQNQKKNLVNVNLVIPIELYINEKQEYHKRNLSELYRSFVVYYPEAHSNYDLNDKVIKFLDQLYKAMKKRYFFLKQKDCFTLQIQKLCSKLKKQKYVENKKKMLSGQIKVKDLVLNRSSVFEDFTLKKKQQEEMMRILKDSQIKLNTYEESTNQKAQHGIQSINTKQNFDSPEKYTSKSQSNENTEMKNASGKKQQETKEVGMCKSLEPLKNQNDNKPIFSRVMPSRQNDSQKPFLSGNVLDDMMRKLKYMKTGKMGK